jgi:hypothetical protein
MAIYSVSVDLNKLGKNYDLLTKELKKCADWCRPLTSQWLVVTAETAQQLSERLIKALDGEDGLLVIGVNHAYAGWLTNDIWFWLKKYL